MTKKSPRSFLLLLGILLLLMSIPAASSEKTRGRVIALFAPIWEGVSLAKHSFLNFFGCSFAEPHLESLQQLQLENVRLKSELGRLRDLFQGERHLSKQWNFLRIHGTSAETIKPLVQRHQNDLQKLLTIQLQAIPAQVIYRAPGSWNSSLWINVGSDDNIRIGHEVIAKNSPVIVGSSIVGVIEQVTAHQSRVRLITDSGLTPSVRAVRGSVANYFLKEQIDVLMQRLVIQNDLFSTKEEKRQFFQQMENIKEKLSELGESNFLAKGILQGSSKPLWNSRGDRLRGIGFNYDFSDEEGLARDLRSGMVVNGSEKISNMPIIKVHDILITTGMDGLFPAGFQVAEVTKIGALKEGDYAYELEAKPTAVLLHELSTVFVIPPLETLQK